MPVTRRELRGICPGCAAVACPKGKLRQARKESWNMELTFVAKDPDSVPDGSPALYRTDRKSWIVQGWAVTDPAALAVLDLPEGETCVEIPDRLIPYFQTRT